MNDIKVIGRVDLKALQNLYERLVSFYRGSNFVGSKEWTSGTLTMHHELFAPHGEVIDYSSWFSSKIIKGVFWNEVLVWHKDATPVIGHSISLAYPSPTQFLAISRDEVTVYTPEVGELVQVDLTRVLHRTNPDSCGRPRLMLRVKLQSGD